MQWILDRIKERNTWLGIVSLVGALGVTLKPELSEAIVTAGIALGGVVAILFKDEPKAEAALKQLDK